MRDLAKRLLALEAASQSASHPQAHEAVRVCEKLRISLTRFAGADGFTSLLRRAVALGRAEVPWLHGIQVKADNPDEVLEQLAADATSASRANGVQLNAIVAYICTLSTGWLGNSP